MSANSSAPSAFGFFARRVGKHAALYAAAPLVGFVTSLVNLVVLTRLLDRSAYGRLAVMLVFASLLTVLYNLGSIQGTFRAGFAATEGEEVSDSAPAEPAADRRGAVGTGLAFTALVAALGTLAVWLYVSSAGSGFLRAESRNAVLLAGATGGLGAVWRLTTNFLRLERRPFAYLLVHSSRSVLALAAAVPLVIGGAGVSGVMGGWAVGTGLSAALGLWLGRHSYRVAFTIAHVRRIFRAGRPLITVAIGFWLLENADVFVLSHFTASGDIATYRVASRIGTLVAYVGSAYLMAWGPLAREPIYLAAQRERGERAVNEELSNYLVAAMLYVLVWLAVFGHTLAGLAPRSYGIGTGLILLLGCRWAAKAIFQLTYRTSVFPSKPMAYAVITPAAAIAFVGLAIVLVARFGVYGAAAAAAAAPAAGALAMLAVAARAPGTRGVSIALRQLALIAAIAGGWVGAVLAAAGSSVAPAVDAAAVVGYPLTLVGIGILPWTHLRSLVGRTASPPRSRRLWTRVAMLDSDDRELVLGAASGAPIDEALLPRFVAALRTVAGIGASRTTDSALGAYLVFRGPAAERDQLARALWGKGVDPLEADALRHAVQTLARRPRERARLARA